MRKLGPQHLGPSLPFSEAKRKPRSTATLNLDREHGEAMPPVTIGANHTMTVSGKVKSLSSDEYGHRVEMDVKPSGIEHEPQAPKSLTQAMKARKMPPL